jgi:hypothetical protein
VAPDILIVAATLLSGLAISSIIAAWASGGRSVTGIVALAVGLGLFALAWVRAGGLQPSDIPDSFILVAARLFN